MNESKDTNEKKTASKRKGEELDIVDSGEGLSEIKQIKLDLSNTMKQMKDQFASNLKNLKDETLYQFQELRKNSNNSFQTGT